MKTIVFGGTKEQEDLYRIANCLFEVAKEARDKSELLSVISINRKINIFRCTLSRHIQEKP